MQELKSAVFDLDETLLNWDSTAAWILGRVTRSYLRFVLSALALPFAGPLILSPQSRRWGTTVFLWIATFGLSERALKSSFECFADKVKSGEQSRVAWHDKGLAELRRYLDEGGRVAVATGAPLWIAAPLLARIDGRITVAGSKLHRFLGGWILGDHCRHERKCKALRVIGFEESWSAAYTDSFDDLPILRKARSAFAVNASAKTRKKLDDSGLSVRYLNW
ncbi:HAD family hydrolase [Rhizobium sp. BK602]|uniref:HAD family hydrolase n=1 Tax=Rhizobium sp. BK602 TaxID=2586986 RepID=UPI001622EB75|nr:HAD family hydrolase [Rhizobium sp. BK602]MBB3613019.1 phosphatidylglycerophosphatase C [Rhizobium sp. BK602]